MVKYTGYKEEDLTETVEEVKCFALEINPKFISTLKYKFSKPEYLNVAKHEFKFWIDDSKVKEWSVETRYANVINVIHKINIDGLV